MRHAVADAGVILGWFESGGPNRSIRADYEAGTLAVVGPPGLLADVLSLVAERSDVVANRLATVATELQRLGFELRDPPVTELARWVATGLAGHRAAYPALASSLEIPLLTDDPELRRVASGLLPDG